MGCVPVEQKFIPWKIGITFNRELQFRMCCLATIKFRITHSMRPVYNLVTDFIVFSWCRLRLTFGYYWVFGEVPYFPGAVENICCLLAVEVNFHFASLFDTDELIGASHIGFDVAAPASMCGLLHERVTSEKLSGKLFEMIPLFPTVTFQSYPLGRHVWKPHKFYVACSIKRKWRKFPWAAISGAKSGP